MRTLTQEQFEKEFGAEALNQLETPQEQTGGVGSFAKGVGKGVLESSIGTARLLQTGGQAVLAGITPGKSFADIKEETGFKSLQGEQAQEIDELLKSENNAEKAGKLTAFIAEMLLPTGSRKLTGKALEEGSELVGRGVKQFENLSEPIVKAGKETVENIVAPEKIMQRVARINPSDQAKFEKIAEESVGDYLVKRKIFGSPEEITEKLVAKFQASKSRADDALSELTGTFKPRQVKTALTELVKKEASVSSPGAISPDFRRVRDLLNKFNSTGLDMTEINEVKRLLERNVKMDFLKQNLPEGVKKANILDDSIRKWQFETAEKLGLKNLPELNKETRLAKQLADSLGKKLAGSQANNAIGLTDWVILAGGDPTAVAGFIGKKVLSSKSLQSRIAERMTRDIPQTDITAQFGKPRPGLSEFLNR